MSARDAIRQAGQLVRLRDVRVRGAAARLAAARTATQAPPHARRDADAAADAAGAAHEAARTDLATDPAEAERLLALLDRARFDRSIAGETVAQARAAEEQCLADEGERRRAMIVAQARHDAVAARVGAMRRHALRLEEERQALDSEDIRRFR